MLSDSPGDYPRLDDLHAELAMIDENLVRDELTVLERSDSLRRRKGIFEQLCVETMQYAGPGRGQRGKRRKDFAALAEAIPAQMGCSPCTI